MIIIIIIQDIHLSHHSPLVCVQEVSVGIITQYSFWQTMN